jgi:hypothetical protein
MKKFINVVKEEWVELNSGVRLSQLNRIENQLLICLEGNGDGTIVKRQERLLRDGGQPIK